MSDFRTNNERDQYIQALRDWTRAEAMTWINPFMVTFRSRQNFRYVEPRDEIHRSLNKAKNIFQKAVFGRSNMRRSNDDPNKLKIGFFPVTEYTQKKNFGWHAHALIDVPIHLDEDDIEQLFYKAWIQTESFGQIGYSPSLKERKVLRNYSPILETRDIVQVDKVYSDGAISYLNKKKSKTNSTDYALNLYQFSNF